MPSDDAPGDVIADNIESMGETNYPTSFTGDSLNPNGSITVYTTTPAPDALVAAVATLNTAGLTISFASVPNSFASLTSIVRQLNTVAITMHESDGIDWASYGPNPTTGLVDVDVYPPTAAELSTFAGVSGDPTVSMSTYTAQLQQYLQANVSPSIDVSGTFAAGGALGRLNDTSPSAPAMTSTIHPTRSRVRRDSR